MKVKFIQSASTVDHSYQHGETRVIDDALATSWIKSGICESAEPAKSAAQLKADKAAADKAAADKAAADKAAADKAAADKAAADKAAADKAAAEQRQFDEELAAEEAAKAKPSSTAISDDLT